ncbi:hypothetical protein ACFQ6V_30855 [Streptomyces roseifaciens]
MGKKIKVASGVLVLVAGLTIGPAVAADAAPTAAPSGVCFLWPVAGSIGSKFDVRGVGFPANKTVTIKWQVDSSDSSHLQNLRSAKAGVVGEFTIRGNIVPSSAALFPVHWHQIYAAASGQRPVQCGIFVVQGLFK